MQLVGYETAPGDGPAALHLAVGGDVERVSLEPGTELAYTLGARHCAGRTRFSDESNETDSAADTDDDATNETTDAVTGRTAVASHESCSDPTAPYCPEHTSRWPCARCVGNCAMPLESCHEEHAIYLAAFAPDVIKVGVTRSWRLDTRLREQGADRAAHLRIVENGKRARQIEADIATDLTDRVRVPTKIRGFGTTVDDETWRDCLDSFEPIETFDFDYGFDLDRRPVAETMATGTVVGTKGRVLVLERGGTTYAVDMRDLVGYDVREEASERDVQSSLGAF